MRNSSSYFLSALIMVILVLAGCANPAPAAQPPVTPPATTAPVVPGTTSPAAAAGTPDLVVTKVWLDGKTIYYNVKNIGTGASPQTTAYVYVNDLNPASGGFGFVDVLKPGEERALSFSNYQWPYSETVAPLKEIKVNTYGYVDLNLDNHNVKVCADARGETSELSEANNCKLTVIGAPWQYDLLSVANVAIWRNADGNVPDLGSERSSQGGHFPISNVDMGQLPQLEVVPQQIPQGWMQGIWGYFTVEPEIRACPIVAAIKLPSKLHFQARVGLAKSAVGSDGVTFKFGLRDLNDNVTWLSSKKMTVPGNFEDWDIDLSGNEGQKCYFVLRVDAGESSANDFAIWNQAKLIQVND